MRKKPILILGAGGHATACIDVLEAEGKHVIIGIVGIPGEVGKKILGYPVIGSDSDIPALLKQCRDVLVGIGQIKTSQPRKTLFSLAKAHGARFPVVCSPFAYLSPKASIGAGTILMHGAIVQAGAMAGINCILNSRCLLEHGVRVGDHCHVSTGTVLNGDVKLGSDCFIGSGAVVREGVRLPAGSVIPMGKILRRSP